MVQAGFSQGDTGWHWRDQLQQSLVRQARRLPYEVPAFYVADKTVGRTLFGRKDDEKGPRKKWYNPSRAIDIGKDIAKTAAFQIGGFMIPVGLAGASKNSSLNFFRTAEKRWDDAYDGYKQLTPVQKKLYEKTNFLRGSLSEVGSDIADVLDKTIKFSERSTGALSSAMVAIQGVHKNPLGDLYAARHGAQPNATFSEKAKNIAKDIYLGNKTALNNGLEGSLKVNTLLDFIPGYKAVRQGLSQGAKEYKSLKAAQVYLDSSSDQLTVAQKIISRAHFKTEEIVDADVNPIFIRSINNLLAKRSSPIVRLAQQFEKEVGIPSATAGKLDFISQKFRREVFDGEYKRQLAKRLVDSGADEEAARRFSDQIYFTEYPFKKVKGLPEPEYIAAENRITLGGRRPESDFFQSLIDRFNEGAVGQGAKLNLTAAELKKQIRNLDDSLKASFAKNEYLDQGRFFGVNIKGTAEAISQQFNREASASVLRGGKLKQDDFLNLRTASIKARSERNPRATLLVEGKKSTLRKNVAKTIGVDSSDENAMLDALRSRGFDTDNFEQMTGYLIQNKKMTASGPFGSLSNFFGAGKYSLDDYLKNQDKFFEAKIQRKGTQTPLIGKNVANKVEVSNIPYRQSGGSSSPIRRVIDQIKVEAAKENSASNLKGFFQVGSGDSSKLINLNPISSGIRKATEFLATEVRVPIINVNPLQLLGFKDFQAMSKAGQFKVSSAVGRHPFVGKVGDENFTADMYSWHSTGGFLGTKGKLFAYQSAKNVKGQEAAVTESVQGFYRPLAVGTASMFTRTAELAGAETTSQTRTATGLLGKIRERLDYDVDQPNSLFRFFGRLYNRKADINNEAVIGKIISANIDEPFTIGGFGKKTSAVLRRLADSSDETIGYEVRNAADDSLIASHSQLMESFTRFADRTLSYGFDKKVSRAYIEKLKGLGEINIKDGRVQLARPGSPGKFNDLKFTVDELLSPQTPTKAKEIISVLSGDLNSIKNKYAKTNLEQYQAISKAFIRIKNFADVTDFSAQSRMFESSSSIVTRSDEMGFEVMRYLIQRQALLPTSDPTKVITEVAKVVDDLFRKGQITAGQKAEAQAAAFSTALNISAFKTFKYTKGSNTAGNVINTLNRFDAARQIFDSAELDNVSLIEPFTTGTVAGAGRSSINPLGRIAPFFKKNLGMGEYVSRPIPSSLSGRTEQNPFTFIPTFATALQRNPKATILSTAGIHTYGNEEGFSLASVPLSYGFQRLNRYFGTVGAGLKESNFRGPLDLYFRGMNAERVLPAAVIGTTAFTVDRTLGGYTQGKDDRGERVYSPLFIGAAARVGVEAQALVSGLAPGGMGYFDKREQLLEGEVPIRKGRYWPLGNTPFKGGKIEYYRPSWYRRLQGGAMFTSDTFGSPMEKFLYHNDFSPLRPLDPYRFERKHYQDRPYPITGEYFSGPYGAAVPVLNATIGRVLKPQKIMHPVELERGLASYEAVGQRGAYLPTNESISVGRPIPEGQIPRIRSVYPDFTTPAAPIYGRDPMPLRHISTDRAAIINQKSTLKVRIYNWNICAKLCSGIGCWATTNWYASG